VNILVNLPAGFFDCDTVKSIFYRLELIGSLRFTSHNLPSEIQPDLEWADALIMWSWPILTGEMLASAPKLQYAGHIDLVQSGAEAELKHGLAVSISRSGFSPAVSEMALALILNCLRKISDYHFHMRMGTEKWVKGFPEDIDSSERELTYANVGIIGFGRVGQRLSELMKPFHVQLRLFDPYLTEEEAHQNDAHKVSLHSVLEESDIIVLCAASNEGTKHILGAREISLFPKNSIFVNVARAALVDTDALIDRLKRNDMIAALDVFDREPLEQDSILRSLPNVYITPHRAGGIAASVQRILSWLADDLEAFSRGEERKYALTEKMITGLDS
jgi:phosphoglycerate dehydrogenase-like enzyme